MTRLCGAHGKALLPRCVESIDCAARESCRVVWCGEGGIPLLASDFRVRVEEGQGGCDCKLIPTLDLAHH